MRKGIAATLLLGSIALWSPGAVGEVPALIPVQGTLTDADDVPIDGLTEVTFSLYDSASSTTPLWQEAYVGGNRIDVVGGAFVAYLGSIAPLDEAELLAAPELWLGVKVGADPEMEWLRLAAVPYALAAGVCSQVGDLAAGEIQPILSGAGACGPSEFLRGWDAVGGAPVCAAESDPAFTASAAHGVTGAQVSNWDAAYGWGDHRAAGYATAAALADGDTATAPVGWDDVSGVPSDVADGDDDALAGLTCAEGDVVQFSGGGFECTDTAAIAITGNAATATTASNATNLNGQAATYYQRRVSSACAAGSTIQSINADGTVVCASASAFAGAGFARTTLDSAGEVGAQSSIAIGADGLALVSYWDEINGDLKVAHCSNSACTSALITTVDSNGTTGEYNGLAIGADGLGLIGYYDATNGDLKVAHCSDIACTAATISTVDSSGVVGADPSVAIGADGLALVSYYDQTNFNLKVAHCSDLACASATTTTIDSTGSLGRFSSISIGADGLGIVSYYDQTNFDLKVAHCSNTACTAATVNTIDSSGSPGSYSSLTIGTDGLALISYYLDGTYDLRVAHCSDVACTSATTTTIDSEGGVGWYSSIAIGADGLGVISYHDQTNQLLKVAHCSNTACTAATTVILDTTGTEGTSIAIGADGLPLVSYSNNTDSDLKVAHCSNPFCVPYFRRR